MRRVTFDEVEQILYSGLEFGCESDELREVEECYMFLKGFAAEKVIYGINTGFGPMAQWRVDDKYLQNLQYNIIRSHSTGVGEPLDDIYVKAAMVARTTNLMQARSGVHPSVVKLLTEFINRGIYPYIPQHGSVGASGDLVQLAHIALTLIGEGKVHYKGEWRSAKEVMDECGLEPLKIYIREGLSITNGTSVMTGIAAVNQHYAERLLELSVLAAVWMNEVAGSYDDWMAEELNGVRRQAGQQEMARRRELGAIANKSIPTTCFTSKLECGECHRHYVHSMKYSPNGYRQEYWICSSKKDGKTKCRSKFLPQRILERVCAEVLGLAEFDEDVFLQSIAKIIVVRNHELEVHFYDGRVVLKHWISNLKKESWTEERRKAKAEKMKYNPPKITFAKPDVTSFPPFERIAIPEAIKVSRTSAKSKKPIDIQNVVPRSSGFVRK